MIYISFYDIDMMNNEIFQVGVVAKISPVES